MSIYKDIPISQIKVENRHRKELGNIKSLAASIANVGLLHPIVVYPDMKLIVGERRLAAFKNELNRETIPACIIETYDDVLKELKAEADENIERLSFAPEEAVSIGLKLEPLEKAAAKARQREHGKTAPGKKKITSADSAEVIEDQSRDVVAKVIGLGRTKYNQAKEVDGQPLRNMILYKLSCDFKENKKAAPG